MPHRCQASAATALLFPSSVNALDDPGLARAGCAAGTVLTSLEEGILKPGRESKISRGFY